jgi:hypothetical protein
MTKVEPSPFETPAHVPQFFFLLASSHHLPPIKFYLVEWAIALHGMYKSTSFYFNFKIEVLVHSGLYAML